MPEQTYMWLAGTTRYPCGCTGEGGKDGPTLTPCRLHARAAEMRELIRRYKDSHELTTGAPYWKVCTCGWCEQARALLEETKHA